MSGIEPNCYKVENVTVLYKLKEEANFAVDVMPKEGSYLIAPDSKGQYEVKFAVYNNKGYKSSSSVSTITIKGKYVFMPVNKHEINDKC